jgi:glucose-6-phosphate isomerase
MFSKKIQITNFKLKKNNKKIYKILSALLKNKSQLILSMSPQYKNNYNKNKIINKLNKTNVRIFGMGGSILGAKAIYNFLKDKIKKRFFFVDNIEEKTSFNKKDNFLDLIISKSGNTLETIFNINLLIKSKTKKVFITENNHGYMSLLAKQLKSEVIHHNNFIGGRFSVLSETGMFPAELMGFKPINFRRLNDIVKDKKIINSLVVNTSAILNYSNKNYNSIIINYDQQANSLFEWYQQLVAESLGKRNKGILPIISNMPKDNHSVMQYYLDGKKNNFYTFFFSKNSSANKTKIINSKLLLKTHNYLKGQTANKLIERQFKATEKVFSKKKLPFRSIIVSKRDENSIGGLFCYFILETIMLGRALGIDPYNQPAVELIKVETKKQFSQK